MSAPQTLTSQPAEPEFWQSIDEWMDSKPFQQMIKDEFPEDADEWLDPVSRRQFLALSGASLALAGIGCNPSLRPASNRQVVPYVNQPTEITPGVPLFFATAVPQAAGIGLGLLVKQTEGRPIKCEGNPNHPGSLGSINLQALAAPLDLYDPDRSKEVIHRGSVSTLEKAKVALRSELIDKYRGENGRATPIDQRGEGVRFLTTPKTSPTEIATMLELLKRLPKAKWIQYEPISQANAQSALTAGIGQAASLQYQFSAADVVLSLDADFLTTGPGAVRYARDFAKRRKVRDGKASLDNNDGVKAEGMNRLYVVEGMLTSTGAIADHRLPLKPSMVEMFARNVAAKLGIAGVTAGELPEAAKAWIDPLVEDLKAQKAVVIAGDHQSPAVHLLALAINKELKAFENGLVVASETLHQLPESELKLDPKNAAALASIGSTPASFVQLTQEMNAGEVSLLFMSGVNPVYDAPADLNFKAALEKVPTSVHHGLYRDETGEACTWHINAAHFLEVWGDVRGFDGTISIQQPLIAPLHSGKSLLELLATLLDLPEQSGLAQVKARWEKFFKANVNSGSFERYWETNLKNGVVGNVALAKISVDTVNLDKLNDPAFSQKPITELEIQFLPDTTLYDGAQANNGWLQELPKPITNLTWDNAAMVSPATAEKLKIEQSFGWSGGERGTTHTDVVELTVGGRKLSCAVHVLPAMADDVVVLHLGYGRTKSGNVGNSKGFNTYSLRGSDAFWSAPTELKRTGQKYSLAIAGAYTAMESRRPVRHGTVADFVANDEFAQVPGATAGEYREIRQLTPGTPEDFERVHGWTVDESKPQMGHPHPHVHPDHLPHRHEGETELHHDHHEPHDKRIIPLNLYVENPIKVNGQDANKAYRRWAMTIDLGACMGCSACTMACVSENNIPVVGKAQVMMGRAMHWIRLDRYFSIPGKRVGDDELGAMEVKPAERKEKIKDSAAIRTHFQPVPCQQCEKAQCEVVCPVGATVHSADGLNDMVYNRCVGTRYCSNNCPYKVRRFNFLQYADYATESLKLLNNPEVTVRTRGVMEKCTYCVQRIRNAEIEAEREWEKKNPDGSFVRQRDANGRPKIMDGEILTACQQACPTQAISFGDLNDLSSQVLRTKAEPHNYGLLAELNTMPRTSYLAAIRNPNPKMPQGA